MYTHKDISRDNNEDKLQILIFQFDFRKTYYFRKKFEIYSRHNYSMYC